MTSSPPTPLSLETVMQQAVEHHRAGRLQQAENLYRAVLQMQPVHPDANHNLGVIASQIGKHDAALTLFMNAYTALPSQAQFVHSYATGLLACGQREQALVILQRAIDQGTATPVIRALLEKSAASGSPYSAPLAQTSTPQSEQALVNLFNSGQFAVLEAHVTGMLHTQPESGFLWKTLGAAQQKLGKDALPALFKAATLLPGEADAQNNLAVALNRSGKHQDAVKFSMLALKIAPDFFEAHSNLADSLYALGQLDEAVASYCKALQIRPGFNTYVNLGMVLRDMGQAEAALQQFSLALTQNSTSAELHNLMGSLLLHLQRLHDAETSYRQALRLDPQLVMAHNGLGNVLLAQKRPLEASACYRAALSLVPEHPDAHNNLGIALRESGESATAVAHFERAIAAKPEFAEAHSNLGNLLLDLGRREESLASCLRATQINPLLARAHNNLGHVLHALLRYDEAKASLQRALELRPDLAEAHNNLGALLRDTGDLDAAVESCERALALNPAMLDAHSNLLFSGNYLPKRSAAHLLADAQRFGAVAARRAQPYSSWANTPDPARQLRIGIVSCDMRRHPVGFFLEQVLTQLHAECAAEVTIIAYANAVKSDELTGRLRACCAEWHTVAGMPDEQLAQRIHADEIDILIDLSGHTTATRLPMFAWKPAPVQVSWLGYFATTGLAAIDYLVADPWTLPVQEEVNFTEKIWRLPETRLCFTVPEDEIAQSPLPCLKNGYVTFGCFNNVSKLNDEVIALWAAVLKAVSHSRLILKAKQFGEPRAKNLMAQRFAAHGIDHERLVLQGPSSRQEYLQSYGQLDIALDPFPFTGATTTTEALWMGVPVLTLAGERFVSRQGVGLLMNAGLPDWVAQDAADYVARAVAHASDVPRLTALRSGLRQQVLASPVFDGARFAGHFSAMLRGMWQIWCKEHTAAIDTVAPVSEPTAQATDQLLTLFNAGRYAEVEHAARALIALHPRSGFTWKVLGAVLQLQGLDSLPALRQSVQLLPQDAQAHNNLGLALMERGRHDECLACYRRALAIDPNLVEAHSNLGNALQIQGHAEEAVASCRRALAINPNFPEALNNLGNSLRDLGQLDEAVASCRRALALRPNMVSALSNLANALRDQKHDEDALACYRQGLTLAPNNVDLHHNMGVVLFAQGKFEGALAHYLQVQQINPEFPTGLTDLANTYRELGRYEEALTCFSQALERQPFSTEILSDMLFTLNFQTSVPAANIRILAQRFGALLAQQAHRFTDWSQSRDAERVLRVGFISGDLLRHPVGFFIVGVFEAIKANPHSQLQLFAYPTRQCDDDVAHIIKSCCQGWHEARDLSDAQLAQQIHDDCIDILIDLSGHTLHNRLPVFAWKPAPLQASWLGYFATTGVAEIDTFLADPWTAPAGEQANFTETIRHLPETRFCFSPPHASPEVAPLPALANGFVTFGCFNNLSKMGEAVVALWSRILLATPGSRLFLKARHLDEPGAQQTTLQRFARHGVAAERLILQGHTARGHYLERYKDVDIALDPFPYTGGTTTAEALWMGVPVLTLAGERLVGRQGVGLLMNAGLPQWVVQSEEEYLQRAVSHAGDVTALAALRSSLRAQVATSPVFDAARFAGNFEATLRAMWRERCGNK